MTESMVGCFDSFVSDIEWPLWLEFLSSWDAEHGCQPVDAAMLVEAFRWIGLRGDETPSNGEVRHIVNRLLWHATGRVFGELTVSRLGKTVRGKVTYQLLRIPTSHKSTAGPTHRQIVREA